jgi:hypothetical protein
MLNWQKKHSSRARMLAYAAAAILAFALAAGVGAMAALTLGDDQGFSEREEPRPLDERESVARPQKKEAASQPDEAGYVSNVGDIQAKAVETFLDSHDKLLRYDALTAEDVEEMKANEVTLGELTAQVDGVEPPQRYGEQYEVFRSAISELIQAAQLAYDLAADPVAAAETGFDSYDARINEAAALLHRSNELLGRDYKTLEGVQEISPQF